MKTDGLKIIILSVFLTFSCINVMGQKYNNIDKQGRRQGKWIEYFDNGKVRFEGQFKDDFPIGEFVYYDESGAVKVRNNYWLKVITRIRGKMVCGVSFLKRTVL